MTGEIYMAATGALAYEKRLEVLSNNLANVNTVGFKQDKSHFQKYFLTDPAQNQLNTPDGEKPTQAPSFWFRMNTYTDLTPGPMKETGNRFTCPSMETDFSVCKPPGESNTRAGVISASALKVLWSPRKAGRCLAKVARS